MIRMSKEMDYGIILLTHFARYQKGLKHSAREVARESRLPVPMVRKILKILARGGILISHRGANGGYSLARRGEKISVAEVIKAVEGPLAITECIEAPGECRVESVCQLRTTWQKINDTVLETLDNMMLSDLTNPVPELRVPLKGSGTELISLH